VSRAISFFGRARAASLLGVLTMLAACSDAASKPVESDAAALAARAEKFSKALAAPDSNGKMGGAIARWIMPDDLKEISGLTLTRDGRLFGHGDEHAHVFEIDYRRGMIVKEFTLAEKGQAVKGDFEAITVADDGRMFLLESNGKVYEFKEGADSSNVGFTVHDTGLKDECEFESVAFVKPLNSLLLACKKVTDKKLKDSVVVFRWKLDSDALPTERLSHFTVPMVQVIGANGWDGFHPSDITVNPFNGDYVLIASRESGMLEITPAGKVVFSRPLPGTHDQAEGIAITSDSLLILSDEAAAKKADPIDHPHRVPDVPGAHRPAFVTVYRWHE
jgi:uncharacterized protein YjiK